MKCIKPLENNGAIGKLIIPEYDCLSCLKTIDWLKCFKDGRHSTEDHSRFRRPSTFKNDDVAVEICKKAQIKCSRVNLRESQLDLVIKF